MDIYVLSQTTYNSDSHYTWALGTYSSAEKAQRRLLGLENKPNDFVWQQFEEPYAMGWEPVCKTNIVNNTMYKIFRFRLDE